MDTLAVCCGDSNLCYETDYEIYCLFPGCWEGVTSCDVRHDSQRFFKDDYTKLPLIFTTKTCFVTFLRHLND